MENKEKGKNNLFHGIGGREKANKPSLTPVQLGEFPWVEVGWLTLGFRLHKIDYHRIESSGLNPHICKFRDRKGNCAIGDNRKGGFQRERRRQKGERGLGLIGLFSIREFLPHDKQGVLSVSFPIYQVHFLQDLQAMVLGNRLVILRP